jgi:hypothetical protein
MKLILTWLRWIWFNEDGLFGIGMGPSTQEKQQSGDIGDLANFATSAGESDITSANNFWQSVLSGDPSQISKVLGPLMSTVNKQGQQQKKTLAEFGNRSGGTNATAQNIDDNTRTTVDSAISSLTGNAAGALGATGSSLLSTGLSGHEAAFESADTIQKQRSAQINDIFKSIASFAAAPFTGGASLASLTGSPSGGGFRNPFGGGGGGGGWNSDWGADPDASGGNTYAGIPGQYGG